MSDFSSESNPEFNEFNFGPDGYGDVPGDGIDPFEGGFGGGDDFTESDPYAESGIFPDPEHTEDASPSVEDTFPIAESSPEAPAVREYLVRIDTEELRTPDVKEARNNMVEAVKSLAEQLQLSDATTTADGRPIHRDSAGKTELDRASTLTGTTMVSHQYGEDGLHIGTEENRPVVRLVERTDGSLQITTVRSEDPLQAAVRGGEWGSTTRRDRVARVEYEKFVPGRREGLITVESWQLDTTGDGDSGVRMFPAVTENRMSGVASREAGTAEYEKATGIVDRIRGMVFGQPE